MSVLAGAHVSTSDELVAMEVYNLVDSHYITAQS